MLFWLFFTFWGCVIVSLWSACCEERERKARELEQQLKDETRIANELRSDPVYLADFLRYNPKYANYLLKG